MSKKIFRSIIAATMIVLLASLLFITGFLYEYFNRTQVNRLKEELSLASAGVEQIGEAYFDSYHPSMFRFTLVNSDGSVIYDSQVDSDAMENHGKREEINEALENGHGSSARYSATLTERTFYEAVRLNNGTVLRISTTQVTIATLILGMSPFICTIVLISILLSILLSQKMAKSIVKPLEQLDLDEPSNNDTYEELTPILSRLNRQHKQIALQLKQLKQKTDEFRQVTDSMNEGLILLDSKGMILSINNAAKKLYDTDDSAVGKHFLTFDRSAAMTAAVDKALSGTHGEFREERNSREYQYMISPTVSDGKLLGAVILCIDVSEVAFAERNRKEFTANVSHELKTPLQSIIGSAELLENGLVKAADTDRFIGNIKNEALRLVALINDIIRLSRLDEMVAIPTESVDIYGELCEAVRTLTPSAEKRSITITTDGESCITQSVRSYIYEIIYNLTDNAIRYNKEGGAVSLSLKRSQSSVTLTVSDNGIGIPSEHQSRIFERFYRVDKSHSRETGGTGLGLSIVKHAVECVGGTLSLDSRVDVGTTVTVVFPLRENESK